MAEAPPDPDKFNEAVRALRRRAPVTDKQFRQLSAEARRQAFWVSEVADARLVQEVKNALVRAVDQGTTLEQFRAEMGQLLDDAWGGPNPPRLEALFRTNVMSAYNTGRAEIFSDPEVRKARPYLRYDAAIDSRTSEICDKLDGTILPADDPFWKTHTPPLHFGCRSVLTPLSVEEAEAEGIGGPPGGAAADPGFGTVASAEDWKPDLSSFDPDIRRALEDRLEAAE